ncbi:MAG: metallophosphoesterase [Bacteroidales bacterium]|nr:metallophosphoesterase [Bacteroidales bacterium]MDD4820998.1 metallophosphoesterase [Bacteroidales bacterium]
MKKQILYISLCLGCMLSSFVSGQEKVKLSDPNSFSMILLPDPQSYIKYDYNQGIFDMMLGWICNSIDPLSIKTVLCTGDLVEQNGILVPRVPPLGNNGNQTSRQMWESVSRCFERLDNKVPYIICTGNHDYGYEGNENRNTQFQNYFYPERNSCWKKSLVSVCKNAFGFETLENAAYEIKTDMWGKLLVISAEYAPRDEVLKWAKDLCEKYKDHKVILLTHSYMAGDGAIVEHEGEDKAFWNFGRAIWEKVIYPSENVRLVLCGHYAAPDDFKANTAFREDKNASGKIVAQMFFNAQANGGGWNGNGGDGWLRILEFLPDGKTIHVRTFSPLFACSPTTMKFAWRKEKFDDFFITLD